MNIVFNLNHLGLEGLGATLSSLIRNCSDSKQLKLWFLCSQFKKQDKENIKQLLNAEKFLGAIEFIDFDAVKIFGHLRSLHGDWTGYGRLLISQYIKDDSALYLDADLIISLDILDIKKYDFEENILAAVYATKVGYALEHAFFTEKLKWSPETAYFNSGVVYFNLKKWRELDVNSKWKSLSEQYPNELLSIDQTLLNAICEGKFKQLPQVFNNPWYPKLDMPEDALKSIIHFVGSPKPWDYFGRTIHSGFKTWKSYNTPFWQKKYSKLSLEKMKRTWEIKKSILKYLTK